MKSAKPIVSRILPMSLSLNIVGCDRKEHVAVILNDGSTDHIVWIWKLKFSTYKSKRLFTEETDSTSNIMFTIFQGKGTKDISNCRKETINRNKTLM